MLHKHKKAVLAHSCFWRGHLCKIARSEVEYGVLPPKIEANCSRDQRNRTALIGLGCETHTLWECEIGDLQQTQERLQAFLHDKLCTLSIPALSP
ncbi:MAG: hypothetical protein KJ999_16190 [Gammaproteobacteria bacterium]|nr:hypothetical protein [Gammaproteobacteria bacterium]